MHCNTRPARRRANSFPRPPLLPSCLGAVVFAAASLVIVAEPEGLALPPEPVQYAVYAGAAVFLSLAVWALVLFVRRKSPLRAAADAAHRHPCFPACMTTTHSASCGQGTAP